MKQTVKLEVKKIIKVCDLTCSISIEEFKNKINWSYISYSQKLSEDFIREFKDKVDWKYISYNQKLSEEFIKEFKDRVNWSCISEYQKLSEEFIKEFKDKVDWYCISYNQKLSEEFIKEFKNKINWSYISYSQKLSEEFIKEFKDKVDWKYISKYQKLSEEFIKEFKDNINIEMQKRKHAKKSLTQKLKEVKKYAKKHKLKFNRKVLHAYRNHDVFGRGSFNKTITYEAGKYYRDWHCDMEVGELDSFGLGIWPKGKTKVKVKVKDWGCAVEDNSGKARVWGFTVDVENSKVKK